MTRIFLIFSLFIFSCQPEAVEEKKEQTHTRIVEGITVTNLTLSTWDVRYDSGEPFISTFLKGLSTDGINLLGWSNNTPMFLIDSDNRVLTVGNFGQGPGEYEQIAGAHVSPLGVHAIDDGNHVIYYQDFQYKSDFRIQGPGRVTWPMISAPGGDQFIVREDFIITPTMVDQIGQLGTIYTHDGDRIGVIADPEFKKSHLEVSPWSQRTHWAMYGDRIFVLNLYWGWLLELDAQFQIIKRTQLDSPIINRYLTEYLGGDKQRKNIPLFYDFKIFQGKGYALTSQSLHQIDLTSGEVLRIYQYSVPDHPEYSQITAISMEAFAILENGDIIFGHSYFEELFITAAPPEITVMSPSK